MGTKELRRRVVYKNQIVFREGEEGSSMYLVQSGSVRIWRGDPADPVVIGVVPTGGVFGEMALFDGKPRMASASAQEDTVLIQVDGAFVRDELRKCDPKLAKLIRVMVDSARDLAKSLQQAHEDRRFLADRLAALGEVQHDAADADGAAGGLDQRASRP